MKCFIYTGGMLVDKNNISFFPQNGDLIIAADSGVENFAVCCEKRQPDIICGDMDSGNLEQMKSKYKDSEYIMLPCEKDDTDTSFAVKTAIKRGAAEIYIIGGIGTRLDHTIANAMLLKYINQAGAGGVADNGKNVVYYVANTSITINNSSKQKYISLIPLCDKISGVTLDGVKYPLDCACLEMKNSYYSVSNEILSDKATVSIIKGEALVVLSSD